MPSRLVDLPDVNVWIALADPAHIHHARAHQYWQRESGDQLAFCRITMLGFLRIITNRKAMSGLPMTPDEAWKSYRSYRQLPDVNFLPDAEQMEAQMAVWTDDPQFPVKRWTDAYLAAFAVVSGCRVVTFDGDFKHFKGLTFLHLKP